MDCSGMIFELVDEAGSTGAMYGFALNRYWGPGRSPMWEQSWGVLEPKWVGSNGEGYVLLWGPHWYGLPNLTVNAPISLELAEAAIWFGYQIGDKWGLTELAELQCFGDKSNLLVQGSEQIVGGSEFTWDLPQEVFLSFKRFFLTADFIGELAAVLRPPKR